MKFEDKPYSPKFAKGQVVRIRDRDFLKDFQRHWKWHNKVKDSQLQYAGASVTIKGVGSYHGGDILYTLTDITGISWHQYCLEPIAPDETK